MLSRRQYLQVLACAPLGLLSCGCQTAPITGRRQLMLMPEQAEIALGVQAYEATTADVARSQNPRYLQLVDRVGQRIAEVSGQSNLDWEFRVLATGQQNAFALPGGKVAVYEGILPVCQNEAGLAVVMSHEVAHALARHGGERMSQAYAVDSMQRAVQVVTQGESESRRDRLLRAYGVATRYGVILPYNRKQESEADHVGLMLMARAGYDPAEAPRFWRRFGQLADAAKPPEFLSTHPADTTRAANLTELLPDAQQLYASAPSKAGLGEAIIPG